MKGHLLALILLISTLVSAQTTQSGGGGNGPSGDEAPKLLSSAELSEIDVKMNFLLNRAKARWYECTYLNLPSSLDSFYDLYKSLIYVQVVDGLRSDALIPGPKKTEFKDCRPPLVAPEPSNKMGCLFQASEINFISYILNSASTYQIFEEVGKVPEDEVATVDQFFSDIVNRSEQSAVRK